MPIIYSSPVNTSSNWFNYSISNSERFRTVKHFSITNVQNFNSVVFRLTRANGMTGTVRVKIFDAKYNNPYYYPSADGGSTITTTFANPIATSNSIDITTLAQKSSNPTSSDNISFTFSSTNIGVDSQIKHYCAVVEVIGDNIATASLGSQGVYVWQANLSGVRDVLQYNASINEWAGTDGWDTYFTLQSVVLNTAPTDIALSASSIMENNAVNAVIGTLSVTDPDVGDSVAFSVISGSDKFNISGTSLRASVAFDYEAATSHSVTVRATDAGGLSYDKSFTISVTNDVGDDPVVLTESTSITLSDGKVYAEITVDPRTMPVTQADGSPLPEGSVLKNASSGQKYYKLTNSPASGSATTNFVAIELVPPEEWGWSEAAAAAWEVLQGF